MVSHSWQGSGSLEHSAVKSRDQGVATVPGSGDWPPAAHEATPAEAVRLAGLAKAAFCDTFQNSTQVFARGQLRLPNRAGTLGHNDLNAMMV